MALLQEFALTGNEITQDITGTSTIVREVRDKYASEIIASLSAEPYGGKATIHYEGVIRTLFNDTRELITGFKKFYRDYNISAVARIGANDTFNRYVFCRGVLQIGERMIQPQKFKTNMPKLRWYSGYELGVAFNAEGDFCVKIDSNTIDKWWSTSYGTDAVFFDLSSSQFDDKANIRSMISNSQIWVFNRQVGERYYWISTSGGNGYTTKRNPSTSDKLYISGAENTINYVELESPYPYDGTLTIRTSSNTKDSIVIKKTEIPEHPFYVRWINNLGGYDYFMFSYDQKRKRTLTENVYYEKNASNGAQTTLSKTANETIEVSSGIIDAQTFDSLAHMPTSPDIRWFNESVNAWVPVQISECNPEWMASQPTGEFLCSFLLPNPQINK